MNIRKNINEYIRNKRIFMNISPESLAKVCNLSIIEYSDIEGYCDELYTVVPLKTVACLCDNLGISLHNLYTYSNNPVLIPKNYIKFIINENNISVFDLSNFIGIEESYIECISEDILNIGSWVMDPVILLANRLEIDLGSILLSYSTYRKQSCL